MNTPPNTLARSRSQAELAFSAVLAVGRDYAQRVEEAQIAGDTVAESLAVSFGMVEMQEAIAAHEGASDVITRHAGHKWGFRTDMDSDDGKGTKYDRQTVIACFCQAALTKLKAVGNEFNIISASLYVTKEGWQGKLARLPGVTEIDIRSGTITQYDEKAYTTKIKTAKDGRQWGGEQKTKLVAYVSATASCKVWGELIEVQAWLQPNGQDERYQVTGTADIVEQMIDQLRGKAEARISERLFLKCVNLSLSGPPSMRGQQQQKPPVVTIVKQPAAPAAATTSAPTEPAPTEPEAFEAKWRRELTGLKAPAIGIARALFDAWKIGDTDEIDRIVLKDLPAVVIKDERHRIKLRLFVDAISENLKHAAGGNSQNDNSQNGSQTSHPTTTEAEQIPWKEQLDQAETTAAVDAIFEAIKVARLTDEEIKYYEKLATKRVESLTSGKG
jgi:hypothetical protein